VRIVSAHQDEGPEALDVLAFALDELQQALGVFSFLSKLSKLPVSVLCGTSA
jgi:hypothetical protein